MLILLIWIKKWIKAWYITLIVTEMIITFCTFQDSNNFSLQFSPNSLKLFPTFFIISHTILHHFRSFLLDPYSTRLVEELFHKIHAITLQNRNCCIQDHQWQFHDYSNWSCFELGHSFQSLSTSIIFICFTFLRLEKHDSTSAISKR